MPGEDAWAALDAAATRVAPEMTPQALATSAWSYATLRTLRGGIRPPSCYAAVWERVKGLEARDFSHEGLCMLFQAGHLMHQEESSESSSSAAAVPVAKVSYPAWLMADARDAWMRNVVGRCTLNQVDP
jgi:hypothetical protein